MRRFLLLWVIGAMLVLPVRAETIKWVDFDVPYESLHYALQQDIQTFEEEKHISWIDTLALAACRTGGECGLASVKQAVNDALQARVLPSVCGVFGEQRDGFTYSFSFC